ncbi:D-ribose pyranase [Paenibacillus shirakamiensis]|uniref:D-ribose pyranase n=1 Tax=Paenibacillus shirakamiensis TaxID=1265935 RepID=A0ABS4JK43_9BACL|nr:D-ribose pyranase [Paenibacillus shirakamiensis]MBP2001475.1 D-ribose pyranase [Paenibacillus shirakamiensis]
MKKHGMLNSHISKVLSDLGHTDQIVVADLGLPIPAGVLKIDLALTYGMPSFQTVINLIAEDMVIEKVMIAEEMRAENPLQSDYIQQTFAACEIEQYTHEQFKALTRNAKVVIRTGEATAYANCILQAGVHFG